MRENTLKKTLKAGDVALGTLLWEVRGRGVLHTLARAGMDFVMICSEHSAYNLETVVELVGLDALRELVTDGVVDHALVVAAFSLFELQRTRDEAARR